MHIAMDKDDDVVMLGEDIGKKGGVFGTTDGLYEKFGEARVMDTPLSECGIVGTAVGMALYGLRPVPEIQFLDFIYPGFDQIVSEMAKMRYRSGWSVHMSHGAAVAVRWRHSGRALPLAVQRSLLRPHAGASRRDAQHPPETRRACCWRRSSTTTR